VDGYRRAWGIDAPGLARHEGRSEREAKRKEPAIRPIEGREAKAASECSRPERRSARPERRRAGHTEGLLSPQPTKDLRQRRAWQAAQTSIERFRERTHGRDDREREAG
jgi:hypothetical protein